MIARVVGDTARSSRELLDRAVTEKAFQQQIVDYARFRGWLVEHTYRSTKSEPGYPDLCLVRDGVLIFAEVKTAKGKVSIAQQRWLTELSRCFYSRSEVCVWRPSDWRLIERILK